MEKKKIYFAQSSNGSIIDESLAMDERDCITNFVKYFSLEVVRDFLDPHSCWTLWQCYKRAGYKIIEVELEPHQVDALSK